MRDCLCNQGKVNSSTIQEYVEFVSVDLREEYRNGEVAFWIHYTSLARSSDPVVQ